MATTNDEYTSVDFLSKIRLQPKKNLFKHLSLDTDLEEINQMLSPKAKPLPPPEPNTIDRQLTKRFVMQLITKYESEGEAHAKWQGFLKSMDNAESFEVFVQSLKEIKDERKAEVGANPENENAREGEKKAVRSSSCKKIGFVKGVEKGRNNLREKMREEIGGLKDLLLAGQRFLRETVS